MISHSFPVMFSGTGAIPPASAVNYVPWTIVGFIFNYVIRRRYFSWWTKYNCLLFFPLCRNCVLTTLLRSHCTDVLSAAMDCGVAISTILIFFTLQFPENGTIGINTIQKWWGNTVFSNTADGQALPLLSVPPSGRFG